MVIQKSVPLLIFFSLLTLVGCLFQPTGFVGVGKNAKDHPLDTLAHQTIFRDSLGGILGSFTEVKVFDHNAQLHHATLAATYLNTCIQIDGIDAEEGLAWSHRLLNRFLQLEKHNAFQQKRLPHGLQERYAPLSDMLQIYPEIVKGKLVFIGKLGKVKISPDYQALFTFSESLAPAWAGQGIHKSWGYIHPDGAVAIPFVFSDAEAFSDGTAKVQDKLSTQTFLVDKQGKCVLDCRES